MFKMQKVITVYVEIYSTQQFLFVLKGIERPRVYRKDF